MKQGKEIKQNWAGTESFGNCLSVIFDHYYQCLISRRETRHNSFHVIFVIRSVLFARHNRIQYSKKLYQILDFYV